MTILPDWWYEDKSALSEGAGSNPATQRDWLPDPHTFSHGFVANDPAPGYPPGTPLNTYFGPSDSGSVDGSGLVPAGEAHYYSGYWAGVEAAQYGFGGNSYGNLKPWPFGAQPDDPFVHHFLGQKPLIRKAMTSVNPHGWPHNYLPRNRPYNPKDPMSPFTPWNEPWANPPWVQPEEWPQVVNPYISASASSAFQRVNPELNYDEQVPGNFIIDNIERLIFDPIRPMTNADAAFIGHSDITPGTGGSSTTPANIPSNIFPGDINSMWGLTVDFGGPRTHFGDGIIDSTGF